MTKAIIFDLFETLITEWGHEKYTKRSMSNDLGAPEELFSKLWEADTYPQYKGKLRFEDTINKIINQLHLEVTKEQIDRLIAKRYETKGACFLEAHMNSDIIPLMKQLKEKGYKLGMVSNCSSEELSLYKSSCLASIIDETVLSYEVGYAKPDREIYQICIDRLGMKPEECIYVGDGGSNELMGASKVGMRALQATWYTKHFIASYANTGGFPILSEPFDVLHYVSR